MPEYLSPGVYVEEVPSGSAPIAGVGTSTAAFIGVVENGLQLKAPQGTPTLCTNFTEFTQSFGGFIKESTPAAPATPATPAHPLQTRLAHAVYGFFNNGGTRCFVSWVAEAPSKVLSAAPSATRPSEVGGLDELTGPAAKAYLLNEYKARLLEANVPEGAEVPSIEGVEIRGDLDAATFNGIRDELKGYQDSLKGDVASDRDRELTALYENSRTEAKAIDFAKRLVQERQEVTTQPASTTLDLSQALAELEAIDEVAIVAAPGVTATAELAKVIDHCENMKDRVAVLDGPPEPPGGQVSLEDLAVVGGSVTPRRSEFAAYYYPWITVSDPTTGGGIIAVPPSGHVAGVYARVDAIRGVHKAPANEVIRGIAGVARPLSKAQQDGLNPPGINCIRVVNGAPTIWGARTLGADQSETRYISVRRLMCYLAESIDEGMQWVVFEPNTKSLWGKIRRNVGAFLTEVWSSGALFGDTPEQAFYVKCDEETNPPSVRDNGRVVTEVGVAVSKPAEFVVFRLSQWTGGGAS